MSTALTGIIVGAAIGLLAGLIVGRVLSTVEESAVVGLDRDAATAKREMYGTIRKAVLVLDVVTFAVVGYFVAPQLLG
jgi:hypothetical protein